MMWKAKLDREILKLRRELRQMEALVIWSMMAAGLLAVVAIIFLV